MLLRGAWVPFMSYQISEHSMWAAVSIDSATFIAEALPSKCSVSTAPSTRAFLSAKTSLERAP